MSGAAEVGAAPLSGVRVIEMTHAVLGPAAGMVLADLGAEVIRIEPPPAGDPTRYLQGFGMGYHAYFNRNKKSIVLNAKSRDGQDVINRLLGSADVLVENFAPGTMTRLQLDYDQLSPKFPRLIYCSLKGFLPGPYEQRTALDEIVQVMSGLAYMTGPTGMPLRAGASIIDVMTGVYGAMAVLLALQERQRTGAGQLVRTALFETAAFVMGHHMAYSAISGEPVPPMPERVSAWSIYQLFRTADEQDVFVGVTSDAQWQRFCEAFERSDLANDASLGTNNERIAERERLIPDLRQMILKLPLTEVISRCEQANLPYSPLGRPEDLFHDPQLEAGGSLLMHELPGGAAVPLPAQPIRMGNTQPSIRSSAPSLGAHTHQVLSELGYSAGEVDALQESGTVVCAPEAASAP